MLVTFGTHFSDPAVLVPILNELRDAGAELVVVPQGADQFLQAAVVSASGGGITVQP